MSLIDWQIEAPQHTKEFYDKAVAQMLAYYGHRFPVFDKTFHITFTNNIGGGLTGSATPEGIKVIIDVNPSHFTLFGDLLKVSHEIAHVVIARTLGGKDAKGEYTWSAMRESNDLVHLAMNDFESDRKYNFVTRIRKSSIKYMGAFRIFSPWYYIPIIDIDRLLILKENYIDMIKRGRAPAGYHPYWS